MDTIGNFGIAQVEDDMEEEQKILTFDHHPQDGRVTPSDVTHIDARAGTGGGNLPLVASFMGGQGSKAGGIAYKENVSATIKAAPSGGNQVPDIVCVHGSQDPISNTEHANAVNRNNGLENCACVGLQQNQVGEVREYDTASTLNTNGNASGRNSPLVCDSQRQNCYRGSVRRLMPIECERLQGMPDNWTRISWRGKPAEECPDAPRYKACGNSMGVNCMRWIGLGIEMVEKNHKKE